MFFFPFMLGVAIFFFFYLFYGRNKLKSNRLEISELIMQLNKWISTFFLLNMYI